MIINELPLSVVDIFTEEEDDEEIEDPKKKWRMTRETMKNHVQRLSRSFMIHSEFHKPHYSYTRNQDGKEYRYNFNKVKRQIPQIPIS